MEYDKNKMDLNNMKINYEAIKYIPLNIARKYKVIPFNIVNNKLCLFTTNNFNNSIKEELKFIASMEIDTYEIEKDIMNFYIDRFYSKEEKNKLLNNLIKEEKEIKDYHRKFNVDLNKEPIVKITDYILNVAILRRASDIHIEPLKNEVIIRIRIDGILYKTESIPVDIYKQIISRLKLLSNMNSTEKRIPQDGKFQYNYNNKNYDLRVATLPTINGEKVAIRILYRQDECTKLESLGFDEKGVKYIKKMLNCSKGMILITGPTGSGKTTTLYAMLNELDIKHRNVITIEDPVEYAIDGISQVNVNNKIGLTFSKGLKNIIRQDPDVIMIGEIRDEETAEIAVRAAITGHLVLATLHTKDSFSSILRLMDMGLPKYLIADAVTSVIAQRLVRKICPYCNNRMLYKQNKGCIKCSNSGYYGRTIIYELMEIDRNCRNIITKDYTVEKLRDYNIEKGMTLLKDYGLKLVEKGITSLEELEKL
ncbi:type IV pilus assembly protein PilB [Clostridium tetanomorphum]|uniref:Type II/IV secretion system protein n=1 Tax=Clostridium tetanomorphum TaxID=1553 RepID=A0A923J0U1_CLOTT|nr:GspE/PulE family protein [Clostridium tetanomorphum]KAJ53421.1 general secretion pathway protein E [Clostridium tetanomorphum DSM 665]MBC2396593.1 type II/IV secretion system protein [Clostridium tetanomorphum]MBP1863921.1 type IV pilus assembly protein PilB [Clostridium tetanomorphum]NRS84999.1 type IV pilus assembly protein PilB [Clostridium tetanomorphum]NRZ98215.1 type IV pilus assembly protein PilB [Clostridium tetanomorphum]